MPALRDHDAPVEVDVLVFAADALGHLDFELGQLVRVVGKLGGLFEIQCAGTGVRLEPLDVLVFLVRLCVSVRDLSLVTRSRNGREDFERRPRT